jgi:hypothetical protein
LREGLQFVEAYKMQKAPGAAAIRRASVTFKAEPRAIFLLDAMAYL